ncbi:MAG: isoprenyl transferase [Bacteroidota bacterium]
MKDSIDLNNLPKHVAVIMDGNGRWAKGKGLIDRVLGHKNSIKAVREVIEGAGELGIKYLTLYTFSTENWGRPKAEVDALMTLLVKTIKDELPTMMENNVKLLTIGDSNSLPRNCQNELFEAIEHTKNNSGLNLILALSYSGKWDILEAVKSIANDIASGDLLPEHINEKLFKAHLPSHQLPDVDLMIRTGGDYRISNFMLWQLAYAELFIFEDVLWPDFRREHLHEAILCYQGAERRFGKTGEQIKMIK